MTVAVAMDDRDALYGPLEDHYLRIGDTQFYVPPTSITVHRQTKTNRISLLRGRSSLMKESGYYDLVVTFTLFFPDIDSINYELRPLLAQLKKCPFLPVQNTFLNDVYEIEALTIQNVAIQSTPGFPNTLQAIIQAYDFDPYSYIYNISDRTFDEMFNWPLFRWYYSLNLNPKTAKNRRTFFEPLVQDLHNGYLFKVANEEQLEYMKRWKRDKQILLKKWMNDKRNKPGIDFEDWLPDYIEKSSKNSDRISDQYSEYGSDLADEKQFNYLLDELYKKAIFEYDLDYESWDCGDLFLEDISVSFENIIVSQQIQHSPRPIHQYLGSQDIIFVGKFIAANEEVVASLENLVKRVSYLTREYHKEFSNGFLQFDHQLARLFGVKNVVIEDMQVSTIDGQPELYEVTLTMLGYNRLEKKMHETKKMAQNVEWKTGFNALLDLPYNLPLFVAKKTFDFFKKFTNLDAEKLAVYHAKVMETFKYVELYPDLELPTYEEVKKAGFEVKNINNGIYVDPDFFISYDTPRDFSEILSESLKNNFNVHLKDRTGGRATIDNNFNTILNEKGKEISEKAKSRQKDAIPQLANPNPNLPVDQMNYRKDRMETLLRKYALDHNINDRFIVGFVKSFDPYLRHFYSVGRNKELGNISVNQNGQVITLNENFKYGINYDYYIGIMRVYHGYSNNTMLKQSIEYNIDTGVRYFKYFWDLTEDTIMNGKEYSPDAIYNVFNLPKTNTEKAHLIATLFLYLGLRRELNELLAKGKQPPQEIFNLIKHILNVIYLTDDWTSEHIKLEFSKLPQSDYKAYKESNNEQIIQEMENYREGDFADPEVIQKSMLHDMIKYDKRGRLIRAFPTFFMVFIDEGQYFGSYKLSDQFFHYRAILDISYNNTRKEASSTLVCELSNIFDTLSDAEKAMDLTYTPTSDLIASVLFPGALAERTEKTRHRDENYYKSIYLKTGVRVHFRMGYGSNIEDLPPIMNGTITSLINNGETMTMVVQDDGIELLNKINSNFNVEPEDETDGFLSTKQEVTEIVDEILTDSRGFWANLSALMSNEEYREHSLGIMHFGFTGPPQGASGWVNIFKGNFLALHNRTISEINMNVYQTTGVLNAEKDPFWDKIKKEYEIDEKETGININLFDKTPWDVLNIAAHIGPDFIVAVHPFGFRSTIFLGKSFYPIHYDYQVDLEKETVTGTYAKTFKQMHYYDSYTSILANNIEATEENMYTVAVGTYMNEGKIDTTPPIYVDTNIWPEKQKTVNVDTTLNAKGVYLFDKLPLIGEFLNKPFKWYYDEGTAIKITTSALRDYVKDMYDGYLTVMGDPSVKPYDTMVIQDSYLDITGPADVKEVIQIMNMDVGYVTMLKPDAIVFTRDQQNLGFIMKCMHYIAIAGITMGLRKLLSSKGYKGNLPIFNAIWSTTTNQFKNLKNKFDEKKFVQKAKEFYGKDEMKKVRDENINLKESKTPKEDIDRWKKSGLWDKMKKIYGQGGKASDINLQDLLQKPKNVFNRSKKIKINQKDLQKLKKISSSILKNLKKAGPVFKNIGKVVKGAKAFTGPVGLLLTVVEFLAVDLTATTVGEWSERHLMNRQACIIMPLKKNKVNWLAGLNGHKGSVVGDPKDFVQWLSTSSVGSFILSVFNVNAENLETPENLGDLYGFATNTKDKKSVKKSKDILTGFFTSQDFPNDENLEKLYLKDVEAAKKEISGRISLLAKRSESQISPDYSDEVEQAEGFLEKFANWLSNLGGSNGSCSNDVALNGKAVNVSSQVKAYEPVIQKYANKYGIGGYTQILMAKMMQESGGRGSDPMQASESYCGRVGCIKNPEVSIEQGVKYFAKVLKKAGGDVKLALQSYNYGSGFIDYVKKHGGKYTKKLAWDYAEMMVKKVGKISRIPPGYGDSQYVDRVLRYYEGSLEPCLVGGTDDYPKITGSEGKRKYHLSLGEAKKVLIDARSQSDRKFNLSIVSGSSTSLMRKGTYELMNQLAEAYKKKTGKTLSVTSAFRTGDPNWHGTGYAVDIDTPNTMRTLAGGKLGFPNGTDKKEAMILCELACQVGFDGIIFGDYYILESIKKKYKGITTQYRPQDHHNHLHLSFPRKK